MATEIGGDDVALVLGASQHQLRVFNLSGDKIYEKAALPMILVVGFGREMGLHWLHIPQKCFTFWNPFFCLAQHLENEV